jgi:hypothetical protein
MLLLRCADRIGSEVRRAVRLRDQPPDPRGIADDPAGLVLTALDGMSVAGRDRIDAGDQISEEPSLPGGEGDDRVATLADEVLERNDVTVVGQPDHDPLEHIAKCPGIPPPRQGPQMSFDLVPGRCRRARAWCRGLG